MEIPNHQRQLEERSAEEITGDQYAIIFFLYICRKLQLQRCKY